MAFWSNNETAPPGSSVPEKRLFAAVLQRAITDYLTGEGEIQDGARAWLLEDEPTDAPLTFLFICESLDLDPENLRRAIVSQYESIVKENGSKIAANEPTFREGTAAAI